MERIRFVFSDEMKKIDQNVIKMGSVVEQMLHKSINSLMNFDTGLADEAIAMDDIVDTYNLTIEEDCLRLLALQQPMASDLRHIAATMRIITGIERMGDYVVDIAKTAKDLSKGQLIDPIQKIPQIADLVKGMLHNVLETFVNRDLDVVKKIIDDEAIIDELDANLQKNIMEMMEKDADIVDQGIRIIMISRYLERFSDHIANVAKRVYYMKTGEINP